MKKLLISLVLAGILLTGCGSRTDLHKVSLDELTFSLPQTFADLSRDSAADTDQAFMYVQDRLYINGFRESKQELTQYFEDMCLEDYVRTFTQYNQPESQAVQTDDIWNISYTAVIDGEDYSFICVFYETNQGFWRVQACCPSEQFEENRQILWNYIASAD